MKSSAVAARIAAVVMIGAAPTWVAAHGPREHATISKKPISKQDYPWGRQGDPAKAGKTIEVDMADTMRFMPSEMVIEVGQTVTFVVRNTGKVMHEMVIGTKDELVKHAELMKKHPGMEHDEPYMAHVAPGKKEAITWSFDKPGTYMYGCLIPGHWEAGMKGTIQVRQ